jgi:hypothetical protein
LTKQRGHGVAGVAKPCSQLPAAAPEWSAVAVVDSGRHPCVGKWAAAAARRVTPRPRPSGGRPEQAGGKAPRAGAARRGERSSSQPFAVRRTRRGGRAARTRRLPPPSRAPVQSTPVTRGGARAGALRPALRRSSQSTTSPGLPPGAGHCPSPRAQRTSMTAREGARAWPLARPAAPLLYPVTGRSTPSARVYWPLAPPFRSRGPVSLRYAFRPRHW